MTAPAAIDAQALLNFGKLRDLLDLFMLLRDLKQPVSSPEGLRQTIELVLRLGEILGLDPTWLARLRSNLDDPRVFEIVLAVVRYLLSLTEPKPNTSSTVVAQQLAHDKATAQALDLIGWLTLLAEIIAWLRKLRTPA